MLINKETFEIDPTFIYDDDIYGTSIDGYPNYYIFTDGSVYSKYKNRFLEGCKNKIGYLQIGLRNKDGRKTYRIHRLLAIAFIPNPENKPEVDHIDRNPLNNNISNLRWVTPFENSQNKGVSKINKCGIKNIVYEKKQNRWRYDKTIRGNTFTFYNKNKNIVLWCKFVHYLKKPAF